MTHQSHQTNGASLEDCHTNFFALTDLCGIKWRRVALGESPYAPEPLEDPVLSSFSRCLAGDILCVWRRVASPAPPAPLSSGLVPPPPDAGGGPAAGLFDMGPPGLGPIGGNVPVTHPPLSLCAAKELWIFWYGEEPNLSGLLAPELMAAETQNGCWESGLSYECRSLLFKALHNLIERCLLSRDFVRLGKWFVQPYTSAERQLGKSTAHLSFSFAFFVHGESTVCASVDVRQHPPVRCLRRQHIGPTSPDQPPRNVILAPFGMAGTLTGQSGRTLDAATSRLLEEWRHFYPITPRENSNNDSSLPQAVEVLVGGVKMRYPSCYVLVTDLDDPKSPNFGIAIPSVTSKCPVSGLPQSSIMTPPPSPFSHYGLGPSLAPQGPPSLTLPPTPAISLPERVWQDCIMNPEFTQLQQDNFSMQVDSSKQSSENSQSSGSASSGMNSVNNSSSNSCSPSGSQHWDFTDPTIKVNCSCSKPSETSSPSQTPPSYSRTTNLSSQQNVSSENLGVPSVGSICAGSPLAMPSPLALDNNAATPRPPSSVPPCDGLMPALSPQPPAPDIKPGSVPGSGMGTGPCSSSGFGPQSTPTRSNNDLPVPTPEAPEQVDVKSAATPGDPCCAGGPKSVSSISGNIMSSPYPAPPESVEPAQTTDNNAPTTNGAPNIGLLKRPVLVSREYESALHENEQTLDMLYDYSTMDAWLNHPVKRFKPNEGKKVNKLGRGIHLYAGFTPPSSAPDPPVALNIMVKQEIKQEIMDKDGGKNSMRNLFTNEGLQVSSNDLDELFDNSDDASGDDALQVHTPPGSNKSSGCLDDQKRCSLGSSTNTGIVRPEELSKMFPTPPSLEHNLVASPCGGILTDGFMTDLDMPKYKQEIYPNMGSPQEEHIEDWSYVFKPPTICKYVGASKYAPLNNLPSQSLPIVTLPSNCVYKPKPSWQQSNASNMSSEKTVTPISTSCHTMIPPGPSSASRPNSVSSVSMGGMPHRPGLSPISPVNHFPPSPMHNNLNMHMNPFRPGGPPSVRTPIPPPPPYEMPSPASTASSYLNKNFPSVEATTPCALARPPEANSLVVNILLGDTALNIFRDHNFDSCTLCVCNAGPKMVGNIRGADAGIYLAPPCSTTNLAQLPSVSPFTNNGMCGPPPYGMLASPATPHHTSAAAVNGYVDEDPIRCSCGFSAVVNRRLAHQAGLFYEDEMEITGLADDPSDNKKLSLLSTILSSVKSEPGVDRSTVDSIPHSVMDLLRDQCIVIQSSSRSLHRAACRYRKTSTNSMNAMLNALEFMDGNDVTSLALEQGRQAALENSNICKMEDSRSLRLANTTSVHRWPFIRAAGPDCNQDIVRVMNSLRPLLQEAIQKKCPTRLWEAPYTISGPLTWRQFHRLAGRGTDDMCEPQPIPSLVVGHEKDWLSLSPYAIQYWDKLLLEPYSYTRDVSYIVVAPDNDAVVSKVRTFFKELSTTYEMCRLGRHVPLNKILRDGVLRVCSNSKMLNGEPIDDWFTLLGDNKVADMLKSYAKVCKQNLMPLLNDKTLLEPESGSTIRDRPMPSPMPPPSTPDPSQAGDKAPTTPKHEPELEMKDTSSTSSNLADVVIVSTHEEEEVLPPSLIIYLVEPFTTGSDSPDLERLACLALLRCFCAVLAGVPDSVRNNISVQIISQDSIMELGRCRDSVRMADHMRSLALSVFMQCRRHLIHTNNIKSLTGFGTAANAELFLKSKDEKNRAPYKLYTPPYILAPHKEKGESGEAFRMSTAEQQCSVMYLNYCLSEDQSWLLAVATDERGEFLETVTINIDVPNRKRRKRASARRVALEKLMDFILGVMSQSTQPWRLVVGRIGRIGHGELKGWSWLLSRKNLLKASKHLKEICGQCSLLYQFGAVPSILSACLVSLEPDSALRLMPDQFTPDERFSQASVNSQLSTPQDVTCTHILVFPTSATTQSSQTAFQEQHINGPELGDEELLCALNDDMPDGIDNEFNDIFNTWPDTGAGGIQSPTGSPKREESGPGSPGAGGEHDQHSMFPDSMNNRGGICSSDSEEVGTVLQQPLALGYLVSTAPTGRMPRWFWAPCPHLENVCPAFLKNALHLHSPTVHQNSDDLLQQQSAVTVHPLDSQYTTDVLRYVLEGYNALSWLAMDTNTHDRLSCLPVHVQVLMQLYHMTAALV